MHLLSPEDLLPDAVVPHELLADPHRVAVQELGEEGSEGRTIGKGEETGLELLD